MSETKANSLIPTEIKLHRKSRIMEIGFSDGQRFELPYQFLRVYSPSAEVRGHGLGQETFPTGKENVDISSIEPVGHYAIRLLFSDGHSSGIYSWDYLYEIGSTQQELWQRYLNQVKS